METRKAILTRRSVRNYEDRPVPAELLEEILEAGMYAPSAVNYQPWYFVVVQSREAMEKLVALMGQVSVGIEPGLRERFPDHPEVVSETTGFVRKLGKAPVCILAFALALSLAPTAFAAADEATEAAQALYELGLFQGVGKDASGKPNFDLNRTPSRNEAVTMLVRLLGKAEEAKGTTWSTPFTDVADWAKPFVGYAYTKGLTAGTSATTYSGNDTVTASQYLTFVLRALGYTNGTDFQWDNAWELSDKIGLTDGRYGASTTNFTRGDAAIISKQALSIKLKDSSMTLAEALPASAPAETDDLDQRYKDRDLRGKQIWHTEPSSWTFLVSK